MGAQRHRWSSFASWLWSVRTEPQRSGSCMTFFYFIQLLPSSQAWISLSSSWHALRWGLKPWQYTCPTQTGDKCCRSFWAMLSPSFVLQQFLALGNPGQSVSSLWPQCGPLWNGLMADPHASVLASCVAQVCYPEAVLRVHPHAASSERKPAAWDVVSHSCSWINHDQEEDSTPDVGLLRGQGCCLSPGPSPSLLPLCSKPHLPPLPGASPAPAFRKLPPGDSTLSDCVFLVFVSWRRAHFIQLEKHQKFIKRTKTKRKK